MPRLEDQIEEVLESHTKREAITHTQLQAITDLLTDPWQNIDAERRTRLDTLRKQLVHDFFPDGARAGLEA